MLIPDWETDCIALVRPQPRWRYEIDAVHERLAAAIATHDGLQRFNDPRLDIWIRDFAPFQTADGRWVAGTYRPSYLPKRRSAEIERAFSGYCEIERLPIRLDGGGFVHNGRGFGVTTTKLYRTNREYAPEALKRLLIEHLELTRLIVIPSLSGDPTGHVDGIVKWADEQTLLVARNEHDGVIEALRAGLPRGIEIVPFPEARCEEIRRGWPTARGVYVNFLLTRNAVYLPIFDLPQDEEAVRAAERLFGGKPVVPINANAVAVHGGVLNCISWNFKGGPLILTDSRSGFRPISPAVLNATRVITTRPDSDRGDDESSPAAVIRLHFATLPASSRVRHPDR